MKKRCDCHRRRVGGVAVKSKTSEDILFERDEGKEFWSIFIYRNVAFNEKFSRFYSLKFIAVVSATSEKRVPLPG